MKGRLPSSHKSNAIFQYQNIIIFILTIIILIDLSIIAYRKYHQSNVELQHTKQNIFYAKLNPNIADIDQLECIPGISERLARSIIDYREDYKKRFPLRTPFKSFDDLLKVKGISRKTLSTIKPYLKFR